MLEITTTDTIIIINIRRDVYKVTCSILYIVVFVGGSILIYKLVIYMFYKLYKSLPKSWSTLEEKTNTSE